MLFRRKMDCREAIEPISKWWLLEAIAMKMMVAGSMSCEDSGCWMISDIQKQKKRIQLQKEKM